jgi:hypothetical protein
MRAPLLCISLLHPPPPQKNGYVRWHEQQKASKISRIGAQKRGSAITDPRQWLVIVKKWLEMRWWHFQLSKNPPSWPFNGHIAR